MLELSLGEGVGVCNTSVYFIFKCVLNLDFLLYAYIVTNLLLMENLYARFSKTPKIFRKFKLFQGRNQEMAQALEFDSGQIEALMRAMSVAKIIREDKNPCMIEEVLNHES